MFTGIITDVGRIVRVSPLGDGARLAIRSRYGAESIDIGASIACSGVCLTATSVEAEADGSVFTVDLSTETMERTTARDWREGTALNLERSLRLGDELGGHLVSGHVDGIATLTERRDEEAMTHLRFAPPADLLPFIASKGSVALDGTSLTVNDATDTFWVAMIPHTLAVTSWSEAKVGDKINIEIDTIARYVARLHEVRGSA
ncbi:MAG: riboflavin synthase [Pseudomonadota bacterium]